MLLLLSVVYAFDSDGRSEDSSDDGLKAGILFVYTENYDTSPGRASLGETVTYYLNASSTIGAVLDVTIYFDSTLANGSVNPSSAYFHTQVPSPAYVTTTYAYDHIGNLTDIKGSYFRVKFVVDDGDSSDEQYCRVYVGNVAPWLTSKPPTTIPISATYGVPSQIGFVVNDYDNESVTVTWNFGDDSEPSVNETVAVYAGTYVSQNHTWLLIHPPSYYDLGDEDNKGYYFILSMSVKFEDSYGHVIYSNHTVEIKPPVNTEPVNTFAPKSATWSPGIELPFYASARDAEGDAITWTYVFSDSAGPYLTTVCHTDYTEPNTTAWCNATHTYENAGAYSVTLWISDAPEPWQDYYNWSQTYVITTVDNVKPEVLANITISPVNPKINTTLGYAEVTFSTQAYDYDGDILYITWGFGDGEYGSNESVEGDTLPREYTQLHRYTVAGAYNVSLTVDDNRGHVIQQYKVFNVLTTNAAPSIKNVLFELSDGVFAAPNTTVNMTVILYDFEGDPLTIWIDFGDNSTVFTAVLSDFSENNTVTVLVSHVYNSTGKFNVTITYTDGVFGPGHNATFRLSVEVKVPRERTIRIWNWWDTVSLGLVFLGVALVMARWYFLGKFRKELDKKGLSLEEYKTMVAELKMNRNVSLKSVDKQVKASQMDPARAKQEKAQIRKTYVQKVNELRSGTLAGMMSGGA